VGKKLFLVGIVIKHNLKILRELIFSFFIALLLIQSLVITYLKLQNSRENSDVLI